MRPVITGKICLITRRYLASPTQVTIDYRSMYLVIPVQQSSRGIWSIRSIIILYWVDPICVATVYSWCVPSTNCLVTKCHISTTCSGNDWTHIRESGQGDTENGGASNMRWSTVFYTHLSVNWIKKWMEFITFDTKRVE